MMLDRFVSRFPLPAGPSEDLWLPQELLQVESYIELAGRVAGLMVCDGLIRIVTAVEGKQATDFVAAAFPEFASRAIPFAVDWLGRVFAIDRARSGLLLLEPGSAEAFEIDEPFDGFFNVDLVDEPDKFLGADLHKEWKTSGGEQPGLGECVGFKVPLFLGGKGAIDNLELTDLEVYWAMSAQLRIQTRGLPRGQSIREVRGGN